MRRTSRLLSRLFRAFCASLARARPLGVQICPQLYCGCCRGLRCRLRRLIHLRCLQRLRGLLLQPPLRPTAAVACPVAYRCPALVASEGRKNMLGGLFGKVFGKDASSSAEDELGAVRAAMEEELRAFGSCFAPSTVARSAAWILRILRSASQIIDSMFHVIDMRAACSALIKPERRR